MVDSITEQDGVAPQCPIPEIQDRAYIPLDNKKIKRGFLESHKIDNYEWIFTQKKDQKGYVKERK